MYARFIGGGKQETRSPFSVNDCAPLTVRSTGVVEAAMVVDVVVGMVVAALCFGFFVVSTDADAAVTLNATISRTTATPIHGFDRTASTSSLGSGRSACEDPEHGRALLLRPSQLWTLVPIGAQS